jgi:hypothetical protein
VVELVDVARSAGVPAPAFEAVFVLPEGDVGVLQELVRGVPPSRASPDLIDALLELADRRRALLTGSRFAGAVTSLSLVEDGPGYCLHGPLRDHDARTRALVERIESIGADRRADALMGTDLVHFDYHLGNVIVDPDEQAHVLAIVDWGGARAGRVVFDLVTLVLDLVLRGSDRAHPRRVYQHLGDISAGEMLDGYWAHCILRLVDWRLRHSPEDQLDWLSEAQRYLPF